uniref:Abhydrolase_3 domain-containing protein n=1 Tax=Parastrongyloides trichosuri TaxID=131310 RepID=A0A0N4ZJ34_PARTI
MIIPPLPKDISNREFLKKANVVMKLMSNYPGDIIEKVYSAKKRIKYERRVVRFICKHFGEIVKVPKNLTVDNVMINGVPCRIYVPDDEIKKNDGAIIFFHGGAWLHNKAKYYDETCFDLATKAGCVVLSVDYRRAPEFIFPAGVNDCWNVVEEFCLKEYKKYGVNNKKVCVMGDSAGGNFSAVMALRDNRKKASYLNCQVLLYPVVSCFECESPSFQECYALYKNTVLLQPKMGTRAVLLYLGLPATKENIRKVMSNSCTTEEVRKHPNVVKNLDISLLPKEIINSTVYKPKPHPPPDKDFAEVFSNAAFNPDFAPLFASDEETMGMCDAMVVTCQYDVLRDEGILYAKKLERLGVNVEWKNYDRAYHGIFTIKGCELQEKIFDDVIEYVTRKFNEVDIKEVEEKITPVNSIGREMSIESGKEDHKNIDDSGYEDSTSSFGGSSNSSQ